jgi:hypothetical protein
MLMSPVLKLEQQRSTSALKQEVEGGLCIVYT